MTSEVRVLIGVPSFDLVHADFAMSLATLAAHSISLGLGDLTMINVKHTIIMQSRNDVAEKAIATDATHLLFLDSDMTFPPDTLARLLARDRDVVGATYMTRNPPHRLLGMQVPGSAPQDDLVPVLTIPFGCVLVKTDVFRRLPKPWFAYTVDKTADGALDYLGEDIFFCRLCVDNGVSLAVDLGLTRQVGHIGTRTYRVGADGAPL